MAEYELTRSQYLEASWFMQRRYRLVVASLGLLVAAMIAIYLRLNGASLAVSAFGALTSFAVVFGLRIWLSRRRILRIYDDHLAGRGNIELSFDDGGIEVSFSEGRATMKWESMRYWAESPNFILLYQGKDFAQILPKAALDQAETSLLREKASTIKKI